MGEETDVLTAFHLQPSSKREVPRLTSSEKHLPKSLSLSLILYNIMANFLYISCQNMSQTFFSCSPILSWPRSITNVAPICCCFQRSEMASEAAHFIFYSFNILLPTLWCANYSQINNVPNLFGIISASFCLPTLQ